MEQDQELKNNPKQAIILDLSLFILDLLDSNKIKESESTRDHVLEVPSALVLMLRDSRVGSPVLFLFIYSLLVKTINRYKKKQIADQRIVKLVSSPDHAVRREAWRITQNLFDEFSSLIDIAPKTTLPEDFENPEYDYKNENLDYPIRRYDAIGSFSHEDQRRLQEIYTSELNLPEHPLYDQYFSQIYHAQTVGVTDVSIPRRRSVSLDDETFKIVARWKGKDLLDEKLDDNVVQASRKFLRWFISNYVKKEWKEIAFDASLELSVAGVLAGSLAGTLGVSLVTLAGGTIIKGIIDAPPEIIHPDWKPVLVVIVGILTFACIIILFRPTWFLPKILPNPSSTPSSTSLENLLPQELTPFPTLNDPLTVVVPTEVPATAILLPATSTAASDSPNYCLYVVQPGDTVQNVASWFYISELDIRYSDRRVNQGMFTLNQLVRINVPCCAHIGANNGFLYHVQHGDNVFRLAKNNSVSPDEIVLANNLNDVRYIQAGQMLCIPYP